MWDLLQAIIPVVLVIAAGVGIRRAGLADASAAKAINKLVYWIFLPCFLLVSLGHQAEPVALPWAAIVATYVVLIIAIVVTLLLARRLPPAQRGSLANIAMRSNGAFVGLPIATLLVAQGVVPEPETGKAMLAQYLVLLAAIVPGFNVLSVLCYLVPHHGLRLQSLPALLKQVVANPIIWGCVAGIIVGHLGGLPERHWSTSTLEMIGRPAVPLALLAAGATMRLDMVKQLGLPVWLATAGKLFLVPALGLGLAWLLGADPVERYALAVLLIAPTAVASVPMAAELGGDAELAASGVVLSTLLCPLTVLLWLALLT